MACACLSWKLLRAGRRLVILGQPWRIQLFGGVRALAGDESIEKFRRGKEARLLAYLAFHLKQKHPREQVVDRFWPDAELNAGRLNLRVALVSLRRRLEPPGTPQNSVLIADRTAIQLNSLVVVTDVIMFEKALAAADHVANDRQLRINHLLESVQLYSGALLPGYLDEWIESERQRLHHAFLEALDTLTHEFENVGDLGRALEFALRSVAADPLHEEAHATLIRLYGQAGRSDHALRQYDTLKRLLREELDSAPSEKTRQIVESLRLGFNIPVPTSLPATLPPAQAKSAALPLNFKAEHSNLPLQTTRFFGRTNEIKRIHALLREEKERIIILTGPGGSGKTRLALESTSLLAHEAITPRFAIERIIFVSLADVSEISRMVEAMHIAVCGRMSAVDKSVSESERIESVVQTLLERSTLLVLDNFERLVEEGSLIIHGLLERLPLLSCLITSRRELNLSGEQVLHVFPLPLPVIISNAEKLLECPSVRLFVDRAQSKAPEFNVTPNNSRAVAELVCRLEGIPLALEMAATWINVYTPARMVKEIKTRFKLLNKNTRGVPERHSTLHAAVDWSYALLTPEAQKFLVGLSVFRGGWTLEAAKSICQEPAADALLHLLHEHSWITVETLETAEGKDDDQRFRMLETLREFAQEHLAQHDIPHDLHASHLRYYLALASQSEPASHDQAEADWLTLLEREHANLLAALEWATVNDTPAGLRLAADLWPFWEIHGHWREGQERAEALLQKTVESKTGEHRANFHEETTDEEVRARLLTNVGALACRQGRYAVAVPYMSEALSLWRKMDDKLNVGSSLSNLGVAAFEQRDYTAAASFFEEARTVQIALGDGTGLSKTLNNMAILAWGQQEYVAARSWYEEALALKREEKDLNGTASTLNNLGALLKDQGELSAAKSYFEECRLLFERLNSQWQLAYVLCNLGDIASLEGDELAAQDYYRGSLSRLWKHDDRRAALVCFEGLGASAAKQGRWEEAAWLFGIGGGMRVEVEMPLTPMEKSGQDPVLESVRSNLRESRFAVIYKKGWNTRLEDAVQRVCFSSIDDSS